jgi:hypothetical protein
MRKDTEYYRKVETPFFSPSCFPPEDCRVDIVEGMYRLPTPRRTPHCVSCSISSRRRYPHLLVSSDSMQRMMKGHICMCAVRRSDLV